MELGIYRDPTLDALDTAMEQGQHRTSRGYLGASSLGADCARKLWYGFRWALTPRFAALTLRRFADGFHNEDIMAARLRAVPDVELHTVDPATGEQFGFTDASGHVRGHIDGAIRGLLQAPKTWHCWEHKCVNDAKFRKLIKLVETHGEKAALELWDTIYYAQAQLYMHWTGMERHYLTVTTPGGREITSCRTEYRASVGNGLLARAADIVAAATPLPRLSEDPAWWQCKFCDFAAICHRPRVALAHCRTCLHATPVADGAWHCAKHDTLLPDELQRRGCADHLYIPDLVPFGKPVDATDDSVIYETADGKQFANGKHDFKSAELVHVEHASALTDPVIAELRAELGATIVSGAEELEAG